MKDKYGTEIKVGSHVARWGTPFESNDWVYGEITALEAERFIDGDEDLMVRFDHIDYEDEAIDTYTSLGEPECSQRLIVCDADEGEHEVVLTFTLIARSKAEAYDRVKRWLQKTDCPDGACETELKPKP